MENDGEAEFLEPPDALLCGSLFVAGAVVVVTEIMEGSLSGDHVVDGDGDLVGDGEGGAAAAPAWLDAVIGRFEEGAAGARGGGGGVAQGGDEIGVALAGADRLFLSGTLVVARGG